MQQMPMLLHHHTNVKNLHMVFNRVLFTVVDTCFRLQQLITRRLYPNCCFSDDTFICDEAWCCVRSVDDAMVFYNETGP